jgi:hypothetical protein
MCLGSGDGSDRLEVLLSKNESTMMTTMMMIVTSLTIDVMHGVVA